MKETLEDLIKKEPHIQVDYALWDLRTGISDLNKLVELIEDSDIEDLKNYMVQINQLILKSLNARSKSNEQNRAVC